ncbi:MAG TPA: ATP-binding protein [Steroidobacteraceae bacterium]|nr:ATP-binding protein [Steroidobacteraceae bacterium]
MSGPDSLPSRDSDFRALFEQSPDVLLVLLPDAPRYTMVAATEARLRVTHTTRETLGRGVFEVFPDNPDDTAADGTGNLRASLDRVRATRQPDTMPVQKYDIRGPDGSFTTRYWSPRNLPVLAPSGELLYILHRVEEVTELMLASATGEQLRGRTRDMENEVIRRNEELAVALRELREWEERLEEKVRERTAALAEENSLRKLSEQRLRAQLERMSLLDHITRAIAERQDPASIFQVVVRSVEESLPAKVCWIGLNGAATAGLVVHEELVYHPDLHAAPVTLPPALAALEPGSCVSAPLRGDKGTLGVLLAAREAPHAFSSGECEFLRQLSEHVGLAVRQAQLHESLWAAYEELRQTQQTVLQQERLSALGQMASGIAHDINNAITPAMLYLETLLEADTALSPRARQSLPLVLQSIEDVAATVARLREFYRPREMQAAPEPVDLNPLVEQTVQLTRARWSDMPQQRGIVVGVRTELAPGLPAVMGVRNELREALTNLIFNAVDAMPEGGTLTLRTASDRHSVVLEIVDTGVGMNEETRRRCLEPFFTTKGERGTGLGLAMVYGIVRRHQADIRIDSAPGQGTTMRIAFPLAEKPADAATTPTMPVLPQNLKMLLIDDDPHLLKPLREILELEGHRLATADDGAAGVALFREASRSDAPFDVVITDLGMPRMDGRAVARAIKEIAPRVPVILLTGWGQRPDATSEVLPHIDRVIGKPPKLQELRKALAQCCAPQDTGKA